MILEGGSNCSFRAVLTKCYFRAILSDLIGLF